VTCSTPAGTVLVAARTKAHWHPCERRVQATDRQIDALIYELYGLTADGIAVVEGQG
jgi:hypothetical protein